MNEQSREYMIETKRYIEDGAARFDQWVSDNENIKIEDNYLRFIPTRGKDKGKRMYIPFANIYIVREV